MSTKFDELLTQLGTGKWNFLYFTASAFWSFLGTPQFFSGVYMAPSLNYTCQPLPEHNTSLVSIADDSCSYMISKPSNEGLLEEVEVPCSAWDFDTSVFRTTLTADFGLVCGRAYLRAAFLSVYMFANIFSSILAGYLADRFGRRIVSRVGVSVSGSLYLLICVLPNFESILATRFIMGCFCLPSLYFMALEVCEVRYRAIIGGLLGLPWAFGTMTYGGLAFLIRDWRWLQFTSSILVIVMIPLLCLMNESPRWLIVRGEFEKAHKVLQRAARWNKTTLPPQDQLFTLMRDIKQESDKEKDLKEAKKKETAAKVGNKKWALSTPDLWKTHSIRLITAVMSLDLFVASLVYWGVNLSGGNFSADPFAYIVLAALMEVPAYLLTGPVVGRVGRKMPISAGFTTCGVTILALTFIPDIPRRLMLMLALVGKLSITAAYMALIVFMTELFPTEVRLQGIGVTIVASQISGSVCPYITQFLGPLVQWAPSLVFGVSSFIAALSVLFLPETKDFPMPDTLQDLENLWKVKKNHKTNDSAELEKLNV